MRRLLWLGFGLMILLGLAVGTLYRIRRVKTTTTVAEVDKDIRDHLPRGSIRADVAAYLDKRGIQHSYVADTRTEMAMIRGASQTWLVRGDIQILFKFDMQDKLADYSLQKINTGP